MNCLGKMLGKLLAKSMPPIANGPQCCVEQFWPIIGVVVVFSLFRLCQPMHDGVDMFLRALLTIDCLFNMLIEEVEFEHFELGQLLLGKNNSNGQRTLVATQCFGFVQEWGQDGQNCAQILQRIGYVAARRKFQVGCKQWSDFVQKIQCFCVKMPKSIFFLF